MKTSNFANNQIHGLGGISISRYPARRQGFKGPEFTPLMPTAQLLKRYKDGEINWEGYELIYGMQLACLDPDKVFSRLNEMAEALGHPEPILLCFESAKTLDTNPCHRRLVSKWLEKYLDVSIPEWTKPSKISQLALPY